MDKDTMIIVAALAGLWWWGKRKQAAQPTATLAVSTDQDSKATEAQSWLGNWGIN